MYNKILTTLQSKKDLTSDQISFFLSESINESLSDTQKGEILQALQEKGVTATELNTFGKYLLTHTTAPKDFCFPNSVDCCGTGGSGLQRINTSTISAFLLSAAGIPICKHGNKAASGRFGSFDLLENLGINLTPANEILSYAYWKEHLAFIFARSFHPAMKHFAVPRQELGIPTIFNILGPLINPFDPHFQIIGTPFEEKMEVLAKALHAKGKTGLIVRGHDNLDEITLTGPTTVIEVSPHKNHFTPTIITPKDFGIDPVQSFQEIAGGNAEFNTRIAQDILQNQCQTRHQDLVLINTAAVLKLVGKANSYREGYEKAKQILASGAAGEKLQRYKEISQSSSTLYKIVGTTYQTLITNPVDSHCNVALPTGFRKALSSPGIALIAEIKKSSPSKGQIVPPAFDIVAQAQMYEKNGAKAISVLTDKKYFGGCLKDLENVCQKVSIPVLRKDFIIHESQIEEAHAAGASAILLIANILDPLQINLLLQKAEKLGLECLVETHTTKELQTVLTKTNATIIGINNRDLNTLKIDLNSTQKILQSVQAKHLQGKIIISESGIYTPQDTKTLPKRVNGILVGSSLMENPHHITEIQKRPLFKACGIRTPQDAQFCEAQGVDFIGLNFVSTSSRKIDLETAQSIVMALGKKRTTKIVGVFQNQSQEEIQKISDALSLDYLQFAGNEDLGFIQSCAPKEKIMKTIPLHSPKDLKKAESLLPHVAYIIFDGREPGSGKLINYELLQKVQHPYLLAGGLTIENTPEILTKIHPIGIDVASGIETEGLVDRQKVSIFNNL